MSNARESDAAVRWRAIVRGRYPLNEPPPRAASAACDAGGLEQANGIGRGGITWTHDYSGVPAECGGVGSTTVTFTATDACGNARTTSAALVIRDRTPPVMTEVPPDAVFPSEDQGNVADLARWLVSTEAVDACGPVTITHNFTGLSGGFGLTGWATVTWTATDACENTAPCTATVNLIAADGRGRPGVKGSFLNWPNVELKSNAAGQLIQHTFITLSNGYPEYVHVQLYLVQIDPPLPDPAKARRPPVVRPAERPEPAKRRSRKRNAVRRRFRLLNNFVDGPLSQLGPVDAVVWLVLYRHGRRDGTTTAAVSDLARRTGRCEAAVRRSLRRLIAAGLLRRVKRGSLLGGPSVYELLDPNGKG